MEILQRAHSENFHLSKCSPGYFHTLEILQWCPQREFPSLNSSSPQVVIGQISSPNQANRASKAWYLWFPAKCPPSTSVLMQWPNIEMKEKRRMNEKESRRRHRAELTGSISFNTGGRLKNSPVAWPFAMQRQEAQAQWLF